MISKRAKDAAERLKDIAFQIEMSNEGTNWNAMIVVLDDASDEIAEVLCEVREVRSDIKAGTS